MNSTISRRLLFGISFVTAFVLTACSGVDRTQSAATPLPPQPAPAMATFEVTVSNLTNAQPLSPVAVVAHGDAYSPFALGMPASAGLETLAEGGDNSGFLSEAAAIAENSVSGSGAIGPGMNETISIEILEATVRVSKISVMAMLVNTNDAITAVNAISLADMAVGDSVVISAVAYDAGTEANTETAGTIPGPAGGGEGFNAARDDRADIVTLHGGVVTMDDGLATSALTEAHRFDNAVMQVALTRTR